MTNNESVIEKGGRAGKESKCVAAKRRLQGRAATLLLYALGDPIFIFFLRVGKTKKF